MNTLDKKTLEAEQLLKNLIEKGNRVYQVYTKSSVSKKYAFYKFFLLTEDLIDISHLVADILHLNMDKKGNSGVKASRGLGETHILDVLESKLGVNLVKLSFS